MTAQTPPLEARIYSVEEIEQLVAFVDHLHEKLAERIRRGRPCDHLALSRFDLPCPHPDCYAMPPGLPVLRHIRRTDTPIRWALGGEVRIDDPPCFEEECFYRERLILDDGRIFWAWKPAQAPAAEGSARQ